VVEMCVREDKCIDGLYVIGKRSIDVLLDDVSALLDAAIDEDFPFGTLY
jgi:hypothetical protein